MRYWVLAVLLMYGPPAIGQDEGAVDIWIVAHDVAVRWAHVFRPEVNYLEVFVDSSGFAGQISSIKGEIDGSPHVDSMGGGIRPDGGGWLPGVGDYFNGFLMLTNGLTTKSTFERTTSGTSGPSNRVGHLVYFGFLLHDTNALYQSQVVTLKNLEVRDVQNVLVRARVKPIELYFVEQYWEIAQNPRMFIEREFDGSLNVIVSESRDTMVLQASEDFINWTPLKTNRVEDYWYFDKRLNSYTYHQFEYKDSGGQRRFYRAVPH